METENTVAAFRAARAMGADGVELDVRRTANGDLVVHHHFAIPGLGAIVDSDLASLREAAPWVPTFEEVITACESLMVNIEVKNSPLDPDFDPTDQSLQAVFDHLEPLGLLDSIEISSFNPNTIAVSRARQPAVPTGFLAPRGLNAEAAVEVAAAGGHFAVHPNVGDMVGVRADASVKVANAHGLKVIVWTVDDPVEMRRLAGIGVHGIITNVPDVGRSAVG